VDSWGVNIVDAMLGVGMDEHRNLVEAELVREVSVIIRMAVGIHARHDRGDHVGVFGRCHSPKENVRAVPGGEEDLFLSLEAEIKEVTLAEVQYSCVPSPCGLCDWNSRVESWDVQFQNSPQEIIAIA
jgi:hypothetical protein